MNILLIHREVRDAQVFVDSVNSKTRAILYDQTQLLAELSGPIEQLGIVFIKGMTFMGKPFEEQADLLNDMIAQHQIKRIDFLACNTLPEWNDFYAKLNTVVGASSDRTGNLKYGGNWVMESTGQDIEAVYFTKSIEYYQYLLDYPGGNYTWVIKDDNKLWIRGLNSNGQIVDNKRYIKQLTPIPGAVVEEPFQMGLNTANNYFISGNKLYAVGGLNNTFTQLSIPVSTPGMLTKVVVNQQAHGLCILLDGKTYFKGTVGPISSLSVFTAINILDASGEIVPVTEIWGGFDHYIALANGNLYGLGRAGQYQIGPSPTDRGTWEKIDYPVGESGSLTKVYIGRYQTYIVMGETLYGIGRSYEGQMGSGPYDNGSGVFRAVKYDGVNNATQVGFVAGGEHGLFMVNNNKLYKARQQSTFIEIPVPGIITSIAVGYTHTLMIIGGQLYGFGFNDAYQLGSDSRNIVYSTNRGGFFSEEITIPYKISIPGGDSSTVTQLATGTNHTMAVINGVLYGMGQNIGDGNYSDINSDVGGELGIRRSMIIDTLTAIKKEDGTDMVGVTKATMEGNRLIFAVQAKAYAQGYTNYNALGIPGISSNIQQISPAQEMTFPLSASGTVQHIAIVENPRDFIVVKGGKVYAGGQSYGEVSGQIYPPEKTVTRSYPREIPLPGSNLGSIDQVAAGYDFFVFLIGGKLYGLGNNNNNRIGRNNTSFVSSIQSCDTTTFTTSNVTMIGCGQHFTIFVMKDIDTNQDRLYGMGVDYSGIQRINFPSGMDINTPIDGLSVGMKHICVIFDKKLYGIGSNNARQISNVGSNDLGWTHMADASGVITNATSVKCVGNYTSVVRGGNLYARGQNYNTSIAATGDNLDWVFIADSLAGGSVSIESVSRMTGTTDTQITLTGTLFGTITSVVLDTDATTTVSSNAVTCAIVAGRTATSLTFKIPAGNGTKRIKLVTADKNYVVTGDFAYRNPIQMSSLSSYTGTKNKIINIIATDMTNLARVKFNGVATTAFSRISATEYTVVVPDSTSGAVILEDIFTVESNGIYFGYESATLVNGFIQPATSNSSATISGKAGDTLTLMGTFLSNTNTVYFGNTIASIVGTPTSNSLVVTVPVELGTVSIRIYDNNNNMTVCAKQFVYQLAAVVQGAVQAVVQATTIDASGQKYYSILEDGSYFIVKYVNDTSYNKLYSNVLQPIRGIACSGTTLYFCDPSNNRIQSIPTTTTTMLTVATPVLTRGTMVPEAIKAKGTKLFIVCTNTGVSTNDALVIVDGTTTAQPYSAFGAYSLQGIAYNPSVSDTSLYISAVSYTSPNKILTAGTGKIFKTDAAGANPIPFIEGLTNPIDLTFSNGYLVVDGIINVYDPSGLLVSTLNTIANSIITEIRLGQEVVTFTTVDSVTGSTTINELAVPQYIPDVLQLTASYSPNKGPKGTMVTIVGYNMTEVGITSIEIRDASNISLPISATINANVIVLRMPDKPAAGTEVTIVVTPVTGSTQEYAFSYQSPDLINIIPLFSGETKYFHFTGSNLQNIQYVDFVDTSTNVLSANKLPVRNVTDRSFNCAFVTVPMNTTRCLLLDAFGAVTIEDANYFSLSSETCFLGGTPVMTDQGEVPIDKLDHTYTIDQHEIVAITKTRYNKDTLILLEKDSLKKNYPTRDTVITHKHKIYYKGKMKRAESFLKKDGVRLIPYKNQYLYNVLLETHEVMRINGLICETLYPKNPIAKFFTAQDLSLDLESIHAESFD